MRTVIKPVINDIETIVRLEKFISQTDLKNFNIIKITDSKNVIVKYYKVFSGNRSYVLMDFANFPEEMKNYMQITSFFKSNNFRTPEIIHHEQESCFILVEDFGNLNLGQHLQNNPEDKQKVMDVLMEMVAKISTQHTDMNVNNFLQNSLKAHYDNLINYWVKENILIKNVLFEAIDELLEIVDSTYSQLEQAPFCFTHGGFDCKHLHILAAGSGDLSQRIGIVNFFNAMKAPLSYDIVYLSEDKYYPFSDEDKKYMQDRFKKMCTKVPPAIIDNTWALMKMHKNIKDIGSLSVLASKDVDVTNELECIITTLKQNLKHNFLYRFQEWFQEYNLLG